MRSTSCPELQQDLLYWWRWPGFGGTFTKPFEQHPDLICHTDFPKSGRSASHQTFPIGPPNPTFHFLFANAVTKGGCNHARLSATQDVTFICLLLASSVAGGRKGWWIVQVDLLPALRSTLMFGSRFTLTQSFATFSMPARMCHGH